MAIDFTKLTTDSPFATPAPGLYLATVTKAESLKPKDTSKPEYLKCTYQLIDENGKNAGSMDDMFFESDSDVPKYKLGRFIMAVGIPLTGVMEFKDLVKILPSRKLVVDVKNVKDDYRSTEGKEVMKAEIDIFAREAYYPVSEFNSLVGRDEVAELDAREADATPENNY